MMTGYKTDKNLMLKRPWSCPIGVQPLIKFFPPSLGIWALGLPLARVLLVQFTQVCYPWGPLFSNFLSTESSLCSLATLHAHSPLLCSELSLASWQPLPGNHVPAVPCASTHSCLCACTYCGHMSLFYKDTHPTGPSLSLPWQRLCELVSTYLFQKAV